MALASPNAIHLEQPSTDNARSNMYGATLVVFVHYRYRRNLRSGETYDENQAGRYVDACLNAICLCRDRGDPVPRRVAA